MPHTTAYYYCPYLWCRRGGEGKGEQKEGETRKVTKKLLTQARPPTSERGRAEFFIFPNFAHPLLSRLGLAAEHLFYEFSRQRRIVIHTRSTGGGTIRAYTNETLKSGLVFNHPSGGRLGQLNRGSLLSRGGEGEEIR